MKKIIFVNLNGTLKEFGQEVPQCSIDAIRDVRARGHEVCLCTGRTYQQIGQKILDIGFDGVIANNGGYILYHDDVIRQKFFTQLAFINMMQHLIQVGAVALAILNGEYYIIKSNMGRFYDIRKAIQDKGVKDEMVPESVHVVESILDIPSVEKLLVLTGLKEGTVVKERWDYAFRVREIHELYEGMYIGEVTPVEISMLKAVKIFMDVSGHELDDSIGIGDGDNDYDGLQYVNTAVVVEGASQELLDIADLVTEAPSKGGIRSAFVKLGLLEE